MYRRRLLALEECKKILTNIEIAADDQLKIVEEVGKKTEMVKATYLKSD